jgi:hypothetical protein
MCLLVIQNVDLELAQSHDREALLQLPVVRAEEEGEEAEAAVVVVAEHVVEDEDLEQGDGRVHQLDEQVAHSQVDAAAEEVEAGVLEAALDRAAALVARPEGARLPHVRRHVPNNGWCIVSGHSFKLKYFKK